MKAVFLRALEETDAKDRVLRDAIDSSERAKGRTWFDVDVATFRQVPRSPFAYWVGDRMRALFAELPAFQSEARTAKVGLQTSDDFRFVRLWTEVEAKTMGRCWFPFAKGGSFSPYYADVYLALNWAEDGAEMKAWAGSLYNSSHWSRILKNVDSFFRQGLTWPRRTNGLSFRVLPEGCIFADKGPAAFIEGDKSHELLVLCTVVNSLPFGLLVSLQLARTELAQSYEVGLVQQTPVPDAKDGQLGPLSDLAKSSWSLKRSLDTCTENSHAFHLSALLQVGGDQLADRAGASNERVSRVEDELPRLQEEIDDRCFELYGVDDADRERIERCLRGGTEEDAGSDVEEDEEETPEAGEFHPAPLVASLLSWSVGVAFGRFDVRLAIGDRPAPPEPEPFDPLPVCSPAMLTNQDGLPLGSPPFGYPIDFPHDGILVDDSGFPRDLVAAARQIFEHVFDDSAARWEEAAEILGERDRTLRTWFFRDFFGLHLKQYSKSRRKAPIYWPLSTGSGSYTVWLYYHRLTADTLFHVVVQYLDPKIREVQEDRVQVDARAGGSEGREAAKLAKEAGELAELEQELEEMKAELLRVAELPYKPNLNDGVQITAAPLWRLFRHKVWSKVLETTWKKLEKGEYDWAHLAYAIWPERVREKCKTDRSLAIAHELEHLCEAEIRSEKKRKKKRDA